MSKGAQAPSAEELLAHGEWLTRVARALVGEAAAEDVVQDTYEVALTQPPAPDRPVRPWLGGVARNLARMATRQRVRREAREQQVGPDGDLPSPEQLVARAELLHGVGRLVLELPEPLRSTVLLRFFEGMTAAEIARKQGIPAATVRSRLKHALDRIRASLDARHPDRRAWIAVLAPVPAVLPHRAAAITGGLLVKTKVKLLIVVVIAMVVVGGTRLAGVWGGDRARPTTAAAPTGAAAATPPSRAIASSTTGARTLLTIHGDDPRGTLRLEGQVIDEHDAPVAHAVVGIDTNPPTVVVTEADGGFAFDGLLRRDYRIEATAGDGYAGPARLRLGDNAQPVTLRIRRGGTVEVSVTERQGGAGVKGATVELRSVVTWSATTNDAGIARLGGVGAVSAPLVVRASGFAPAATMLQPSGDASTTDRVAVSLARGAAVSGRVADEDGKPIERARVVAMPASEPFVVVDARRDGVVTGPDGSFSIESLSAGTWRLTATAGDRAPATSAPITLDGEHARSGVELVLTTGAVVRGTVNDPSGKPVVGADVSVVGRGFVPWRARYQTVTDDAGRFAIRGLAPRAVDVVAWHEIGASAIASVDLAENSDREVALVLDVIGTITGTVVDQRGQPIGDAQVIADPAWTGGTGYGAAWAVRGVQQTVTDQAGAFRFAGLPAAQYRVHAARPGAGEAALWLSDGVATQPGAGAIRIVVPDEGRVLGKVALPDGNVPGAFAVALGGTTPRSFASPDGAFALTAAAGTHALTISGPGFVATSKSAIIDEGKDTDLGTITLNPGRSISGRVIDERGVPIANATVAAGAQLSGGGAELYLKNESQAAKDTQTDATGHFVLEGFPPVSVTVIAGKDGVGRSASIRVPASPESATVDLVLAATTSLHGKVTRGGAPLADTIVIAKPIAALAQNFFVTTGPDGTFVLDALAPGEYVVSPTIGGGGNRPKDIYTRCVELAPGVDARVEIDASPGPITLAVSVKTDDGRPLPAARLIAVQAAIDPQTLDEIRDGTRMPVTDQVLPIYMRGVTDGAVTIEGMRSGVHTICVAVGDPRAAATSKFQCSHTTLGAAAKQTAAIVVPASWLDGGRGGG